MKTDKAAIRRMVRTGTATGKAHPSEARLGRRAEPVLCERCGALLHGRRWQRAGGVEATADLLAKAAWETCPACEQEGKEEYLGRVVARGAVVETEGGAIRRRVRNVAKRAEFNSSQHRVVSIEADDGTLEVLTTSQKLAHRIARELEKAFGGRATFAWLDDGCLEARWRAAGTARTRPLRSGTR